MGVERINRSGLLGDTHLLRGDSSGGYTIRVHRYVSQPIIQSLGIEVAATEGHGDGTTVSVLKPVFPFWNDVDLYYGAGEAICSRIYLKGVEGLEAWLDERPDAPANAEPAVATDKAPPSTAAMFGGYGEVPRLRSSGDYNTALGAATQPVAGPFNFPDVTQQIYPLLAERAQLDGFVERYLNEPLRAAGLRFETLGSYAYLMVNCIGDQIGTMWSGTNDIGWWAEREVSFCVPVKWYATNERGEEELLSVALVAPFFYASNGRAVITDREVNGRPTVKAVIESPADVWLESSGPNQPRKYLELTTEVFPALGYGQKAESRTLIEIDAADVLAYNDDVGWRQVGERWGRDLVGELMRKQVLHTERAAEIAAARAMALEILAHDAPINWLVLKQYRDAADVGQTCYQALVQTRRSIERIYDIREIEDRVHVRVHRYPGHPIVDTLGLKLKSLQSGGGQVVQNLQPLRPFWMRLSVREELATVVAVRRPDGQWHRAHTWLQHADAAADSGAEDADPGVPYLRALGRTRVHPAWPVPPQRLRERQGQALRSALRSSLQGVIEALSALPSAECDALIGRLPAGARAQIDALGSSADAAAFADGCELGDLLALERALGMAGLVWQASDVRLERLTHAQARDAIEGVGDVQVVLESILGAEWENWGNPRFFRKLPPLPEPRIPNASLQGGFDALRSCAPTVPASLGLRQTDDKAWCYVDPPKAQPSAPGPAQ